MNLIDYIDRVALNTLEGFLLSLGITPSEDGLAFADYGPHRVYTVQGEIEHGGKEFVPDLIFRNLEQYIQHRNAFPQAPHFDAYEVICGYHSREKNRLYVSISHTA